MQNKGNDEIIDTSTTALREYMFQALIVVITVAGLQSAVNWYILSPFFFFSPSLIEVWLHARFIAQCLFFFSQTPQHTVFHKQLFFQSLVRLEGVISALHNKSNALKN